MDKKKKNTGYRWAFYLGGMVLQTFGITLSTKTGLGASCIISLPLTVGRVTGYSFAIFNFVLYMIMVIIQLVANQKKGGGKKETLFILLQIPYSLAFSSMLGVFDGLLPIEPTAVWEKAAFMVLSVVCNGIGGASMINMKLVPNVADGVANTIGGAFGKNLGFGKNVLDVVCVSLSCIISLIWAGNITTIGIGTLFAMIFVGRVMALFNRFFREKMMFRAGLAL